MGKILIVGITGASGVIYGVRLLQVLRQYKDIEIHLIISEWAEKTLRMETDYETEDIAGLAPACHDYRDMACAVSSGSFLTDGMIIAPASMKTVAGIANGFSSNLIIRAADVTIKEKRKLVIMPRETPLSPIHLENLLKLSQLGVSVLPAIPGFYSRPKTIEDLIDHTIGKILDQFGVQHSLFPRWDENDE
jgi:polyprenyl P-hydroxybenzoate/phenylacrylic acid decarboxylase-like protein